MKVTIHPKNITPTSVVIPPSKSMSHRAILCASLADGFSVVRNIDYSDDVKVTIEGMRKLGAKIIEFEDYVEIQGIKDFDHLTDSTIECNESGSSLRFFIPIFSLTNQKVHFTGKNRLLKRPQHVYAEIFKNQSIHYEHNEEVIEIDGSIKSGEFTLPGDVSSQFISGLLFALPFCEGNSTIHVLEPFESRSYVELTVQMLIKFGIIAGFIDKNTLVIKGSQHYRARDITVEADYSQLGFFAGLGSINNTIDCLNLNKDSLQGDKEIISILREMNAKVLYTNEGIRFYKSELKATTIDLKDCPDLGPILMVIASFAKGTTTIINAGRLRIKESDRIAAMEEELRKCGVTISSTQDTVTIVGTDHFEATDDLFGHKDHRIVMSMAIAGTMANKPVTICGAECISKSYPGFFDDLKKIGIEVDVYDE